MPRVGEELKEHEARARHIHDTCTIYRCVYMYAPHTYIRYVRVYRARTNTQLGHHVLGDALHLPEVVGGLVLLRVGLPREGVVVPRGGGVRPVHHKGGRVRQEAEVHGI